MKRYSQAEKEKAIAAVMNSQRSIAQVAKDIGISKSCLAHWTQKARNNPEEEYEFCPRKFRDLQIALERANIKNEILRQAKAVCSDDRRSKLDEMEAIHRLNPKRYGAHVLCELYNINRSTFLNHMYRNKRGNAWWHKHNHDLKKEIRKVFAEFDSCYGATKITYILRSRGINASKDNVRRLMREDGLFSIRQVKKADYEIIHRKHQDLVKRDFDVTAPNRLWFTDFIHIEHKERPYSMCAIIDAFSRKVVAHRIGPSDTANLLIKTFKEAWNSRNPRRGQLTFHSDNGSAMSSYSFGRLLRKHSVRQSFSRVHKPCDNAVIESFFNTFRREELRIRKYNSVDSFKKGIRDFIERYNDDRPHAYNNYLTPNAAERKYFAGHEGSDSRVFAK